MWLDAWFSNQRTLHFPRVWFPAHKPPITPSLEESRTPLISAGTTCMFLSPRVHKIKSKTNLHTKSTEKYHRALMGSTEVRITTQLSFVKSQGYEDTDLLLRDMPTLPQRGTALAFSNGKVLSHGNTNIHAGAH